VVLALAVQGDQEPARIVVSFGELRLDRLRRSGFEDAGDAREAAGVGLLAGIVPEGAEAGCYQRLGALAELPVATAARAEGADGEAVDELLAGPLRIIDGGPKAVPAWAARRPGWG
jgi:hypothetical protein